MGVYMDPALFDLTAAVETLSSLHRTDGSEVQLTSTDVNIEAIDGKWEAVS